MIFVVLYTYKIHKKTLNNSKLIQLLRTFSLVEINDFGKFLNSPFHSESQKMVRLFNFLKKFFPEFTSIKLTKEEAYRKMYGEAEFSDKKLRERFSDMLRLAEEYLAVVNLRKNPVKYKMHTLNEFSDRDLAVHFDKKHREILAILDKVTFKDENSFYEDYQLQSKKIEFYQNTNLLGKRKPFFDEISEHIELFLKYFTAQMLKNYAVINNIKGLMNYNYEQKFYKQVLEYTEKNNLENYPLIKALMLIIKINENRKDIKSYFLLKELYLKYHAVMNVYDRTMISTELSIYSRLMLRTGNPLFNNEPFEMMKLQIEHDTYPKEKGWMKRETFLVSIDTAVNIGRIDWARQFIKNYTGKIDPELRVNAELWASGILNFFDKKYEAALKEFSKIKIGDYVYYFWVKVPVSKIYYEIKEYDSVLMLIDSYKHFTASNKLIPAHVKVWYDTFFNLLYKLTLLSLNFDEHKAHKLKEDVKVAVNISNTGKLWLLEKIIDLKNKRV